MKRENSRESLSCKRKNIFQLSRKIFKNSLHFLLAVYFIFPVVVKSQTGSMTAVEANLDSLKNISREISDDEAVELLKEITQSYFTGIYQLDSAKKYGTLLFELGQRIENDRAIALGQYYLGRVADGKGDYPQATNFLKKYLESDVVRQDTLLLANGLYSMANIYIHQGDLEEALNFQLQVLRLDEASGDSTNIGLSLNNLGIIMKELNRNQDAIQYLERTKSIFENLGDEPNVAMALSNLGGLYSAEGDNNKALNTFQRSLEIYEELQHERGIALALEHIASVQGEVGQFEQALKNHHQSLAIKKKLQLKKEIAESFHQIALIHTAIQNMDSARNYFNLGLEMARDVGDKKGMRRAYKELSDLEAGTSNFEKAYNFFLNYHNISDSILNESSANQINQLEAKYGVEKQETEIKNLRMQQILNDRLSRTLRWTLIAVALIALMIIGFLVYRASANRKLLQVEQEQTRKVEQAYDQLRTTQTQLIQSEKMASLGELTAGIAHEIQNPLNFVNNFSEVNEELITELNDELDQGNLIEAKSMLRDLSQNQSKIKHHGKRADAIVKSMLQHSRISSGQKELTDINALCDEYLRLSYHGMRAKDKDFISELTTDFDSTLGKINVVSQDIGRVLLNLINNAFFAVNHQLNNGIKDLSSEALAKEGYKPKVEISTKKIDNYVQISVCDNGGGIPENIKEKIFQPFFTTKSTGEGTGLGLSLSYDIVKAHGGELKMETSWGTGTEFIINLPIT